MAPQPGKSEVSSSGSDGTDNADANMSKDMLRETAAKLERDLKSGFNAVADSRPPPLRFAPVSDVDEDTLMLMRMPT